MTIPTESRIILNYRRNGAIGSGQVREVISLSGNMQESRMRKIISALFHFVKNTELTKNFDGDIIATIIKSDKKQFEFCQKAGDYSKGNFTVSLYEENTKKPERKRPYESTRKLLLETFGFKYKKQDEDAEKQNTDKFTNIDFSFNDVGE